MTFLFILFVNIIFKRSKQFNIGRTEQSQASATIVVSINKALRRSIDLEIAYEFCMEVEPCAIVYRCSAPVEIHTVEELVRLVGTESSGSFFSLGNWCRVITLPFHTNVHDFEANFAPLEHNTMPS